MGVLEPARRGRIVVVVLITLGVVLGGLAQWVRVTRRATPERPAPARPIPGEGSRIVVEILNASGVVGLARVATGRLRDAGLDVVYFGTDSAVTLDSTEVLVRREDGGAGDLVRRALGTGRVRAAPDPTRLVDVSVRLGGDFAALLRDP